MLDVELDCRYLGSSFYTKKGNYFVEYFVECLINRHSQIFSQIKQFNQSVSWPTKQSHCVSESISCSIQSVISHSSIERQRIVFFCVLNFHRTSLLKHV